MNNLQGGLVINGIDFFTRYGAFLTEATDKENFNLSELLKPAEMKPYTAVSFREENGERLPDNLPSPVLQARDFQLYIAIVATSKENFSQQYLAMMQTLQGGWLTLKSVLIPHTLKVYYKGCASFEPIHAISNNEYICRMKLIFREPQPAF